MLRKCFIHQLMEHYKLPKQVKTNSMQTYKYMHHLSTHTHVHPYCSNGLNYNYTYTTLQSSSVLISRDSSAV